MNPLPARFPAQRCGPCTAAWLLTLAGLSACATVRAEGPAAISAQGYRVQELGGGLYLMSDHDCQSLFMVYDHGVVLIDAPPSYSAHIPQAIAEVSRNPVTHIIYLHSRADHIGGVSDIAGQPVIIAQDTTARLLESAADPRRPPPTVTFTNTFTLEAGDRTLELIHPGDADAPEGILVFAPAPRVLMVADLVFSSWRPWQRFARERDVSENAARLETIRKLPWIRLVSSIPGEILDPDDAGNQCLVNPCFH